MTNSPNIIVLDTYYIIGRTFILSPQENDQKSRVRIDKTID